MRRNYPAEQIMPLMASQDAAFAKAHPNDFCPCGSGQKFKKCYGQPNAGKSRKANCQTAHACVIKNTTQKFHKVKLI